MCFITTDILKAACSTIHIQLSRIDITDVPQDEEAVKQFLINRLAMKDRYITNFERGLTRYVP